MAKDEDQWRTLAKALGANIKLRRKALQRLADQVTSEVKLSASYYRSIEAGSTVPPPSIAMPLAKALDWDPVRTSELLCAIAYLRVEPTAADTAAARRIWLANNGVIPSVLAATDGGDIVTAIADHLSPSNTAPIHRPADAAKPGQKYPWMVGLAVQRMIADLSSIPFKANLAYMVDFEERHTENITEAVAILSYTPTGIGWIKSNFSFRFMTNKFDPNFTAVFPVTDLRPKIVAGELVDALVSKFGKSTKNKEKLRTSLESRMVAKDLGISSDKARSQFRFDLLNNRLLERDEPGSATVQAFHNAWLFRMGTEGVWVGFVDNWDPNYPTRELELAPLAIEDAERLAAGV